MNSDSSLSIFLNQSILSNQLKENEYFELKEKFDKIKFIQELTFDFEPTEENFYNWKFKKFKEWYEKIEKYENQNINVSEDIKELKYLLTKILSPIYKFIEEKSMFVEEMKEWY